MGNLMKLIRRGIDTDFSLKTIDKISTESAQDNELIELAYSLAGESDYETFLNIFHFTRANVAYVNDGSTSEGEDEWLRTAQRTLLDEIGDCDDRTTLHSTFCKILGIPHLYRVVAYEQKGEWQHIYVVAYDRQNGEWVSLDTVPEVPYALAEISFLDTKKPEYQPEMPSTYLLRGAPENASELQKLNALVADYFGGDLNADDTITPADVNQVFAEVLLTRLVIELQAGEQSERARHELGIANALLHVVEDAEDFAIALQNVINFEGEEASIFEPIYAQLLANLVHQPTQPMSVSDYIAHNKSLLPKEAKTLGFVGAIIGAGANLVGQFKASKDAKNQRAHDENMARATSEENARNRAEAEKQRQFELQKMAMQPAQAPAPATTPTPPDSTTEKSWFAKYWWVALLVVCTGGIAAFFIFRKKDDNAMQGAKKKKRKTTRKPLGKVTAIKRPTLQKPLTKPKKNPKEKEKPKRPKPKTSPPSRPKKNNPKKNKTAKRKAQKKANQKRRTNSKKRK